MNHRTLPLVLLIIMLGTVNLAACPTCTPASPTFAERLVHGASPQGLQDYVIAIAMIVIVLAVAIASVRAIIHREQAS